MAQPPQRSPFHWNVTADLLTQRLTVHEEPAWMLRSLLEEQPSGCIWSAGHGLAR